MGSACGGLLTKPNVISLTYQDLLSKHRQLRMTAKQCAA
jgi:hypothetical protein